MKKHLVSEPTNIVKYKNIWIGWPHKIIPFQIWRREEDVHWHRQKKMNKNR